MQGLALKNKFYLNGKFKKLKLKLKLLDSECRKNKISRNDYLISYIHSLKFVSYCILGISNYNEFFQLKKFNSKKLNLSKKNDFYIGDKKITDPRLWKY